VTVELPMPLLVTLLALAAAPLVEAVSRRRVSLAGFVTGAAQVLVAGLVLVHVLPFGLATAGWPAGLALLGGAVVGSSAHRLPGGARWASRAALVAVLVHGLVDGVALAVPVDGHDDELLAWAVVLHSLPVGALVWRVAHTHGGLRSAAAVLLGSMLATTVGWVAADQMLAGVGAPVLGFVQCLVAGALLHVLGHLSDAEAPRWNALGALAGVAGVGLLAWEHPTPRVVPGELDALAAAGGLFLRAAPALLVGYAAVGLLRAVVPESAPRWLAGVGACACGALPRYRELLARGVAPAGALAFLLAAPGVGLGALIAGAPLLGWELTLLRLGAGLGVALGVALWAARVGTPSSAPDRPGREPAPPLSARLRAAARFAFGTTVDHTAPWVLTGLLAAGLLEPVLTGDVLASVSDPVAVLVAAALGLPVYLCAWGVAPLVAVAMHKGLSAGAALSFLLVGPATHLASIGVFDRLPGRTEALRFGVGLAVVAVGAGLLTDAVAPAVSAPPLHALVAPPHRALEWFAAAAVVALYAASLVRGGVSGFLHPLLHPEHAHAPGEHCTHDPLAPEDAGHHHGHGHG